MSEFKCEVMDWEKFYQLSRIVAKKIRESGYKPDVIIGLARGGWIFSRVLCDFLGVKDLFSLKVEHWGITASPDGEAKVRHPLSIDLSNKKILVADDITDTGESMKQAVEHIKSLNPAEIKTVTLRHIVGAIFIPDYFGEEIKWIWVIFPWNYVEDLCNILPKALVLRNNEIDREETIAKLRESFDVSIDPEIFNEVLNECKIRGTLQEGIDKKSR
ncbi:phosphoribosyltransferase [[Eubacterium] cellulosolvens]